MFQYSATEFAKQKRNLYISVKNYNFGGLNKCKYYLTFLTYLTIKLSSFLAVLQCRFCFCFVNSIVEFQHISRHFTPCRFCIPDSKCTNNSFKKIYTNNEDQH